MPKKEPAPETGAAPAKIPADPSSTPMTRAAIVAAHMSAADRDRIRNIKGKLAALAETMKGFLFLAGRAAEEKPFADWCDEVVAKAVAQIEDECVIRACRDHSLHVIEEAA